MQCAWSIECFTVSVTFDGKVTRLKNQTDLNNTLDHSFISHRNATKLAMQGNKSWAQMLITREAEGQLQWFTVVKAEKQTSSQADREQQT